MRASGLLMLSKGEHPTAIGQQYGVSDQTIYNWRHAYEQAVLVGLISGHADALPRKLNEALLANVCELVRTEVLTLSGVVQRPTTRQKHSADFARRETHTPVGRYYN